MIHQHLPIFHTEHCVFCRFLSDGNSYLDCGHPCETSVVHLRDAESKDHLVLADMGCRNTVFNAQAQSGAEYLPDLMDAGVRHFRVELVDEPGSVVRDLLEAYRGAVAGDTRGAEVVRWVGTLPDANGNAHGAGARVAGGAAGEGPRDHEADGGVDARGAETNGAGGGDDTDFTTRARSFE